MCSGQVVDIAQQEIEASTMAEYPSLHGLQTLNRYSRPENDGFHT